MPGHLTTATKAGKATKRKAIKNSAEAPAKKQPGAAKK
ncbi:hypothetical protein ACP4OV_006799 [Aristida adscensionis]